MAMSARESKRRSNHSAANGARRRSTGRSGCGLRPRPSRATCGTRSEIIIPVVVRNRVRGAIVGISDRPDALPPDLKIMLLRSTKTAQLWYELGELHDARFSAIRNLADCLEAWHLLQRVEEGPALYAGLAAILTADCGLGWHRANLPQSPRRPPRRRAGVCGGVAR